MNDWQIWFSTGIEHILDLNGYDHMLFVGLLVLAYPVTEWKKLIGLATAFTIGHSLTLALSAVNVINMPQQCTEVLIILTIIITCFYLLFRSKNPTKRGSVIYLIICCFGLIHGLGFSYLLKAMLGSNDSIVIPLLMFNLGLEAGQVVVIVFMVLVLLLVGKYAKPIESSIRISCISIILAISLFICYSRLVNLFQ